MGALTAIWNSEKGIIGLLLVVAATVLAATGAFSAAQWEDYTKWIFGIYVSGKTVQGAISAAFAKPAAPTAPELVAAALDRPINGVTP